VGQREHRASAGGDSPEGQNDHISSGEQPGHFLVGNALEAQHEAPATSSSERVQAQPQPWVIALASHREMRGNVIGQVCEGSKQFLDSLVLLDAP
jgi:hypothetical protein